ncbi:hypothetical protein [Polaribacter cellanae]|uniref:Outer membrane protein beta-barrel domain-containing protein n=1 Tax=Polaribacter cellanae TaxID=2818493 RepID=A0A975H9B8_9FLAO|nr:hypothetical protein [Polaribacter cellanae]QTE22695.1 hypothetical protein J3359_18200 [Polaribacter cellanae]
MKKNILRYCVITILLLKATQISAQTFNNKTSEKTFRENYILLRPNANIGLLNNNVISSFGIRTLLKAGSNKAYGMEISRFRNHKTNKIFYSAGIIIEQKLFNWFNMSAGTVGYFNFGDLSENVVGFTSNLGWEPNSNKRFSPFITYRSDCIFTSKIQFIHSLNIGLNIKL